MSEYRMKTGGFAKKVVDGFKVIENGVVGGYQAIEDGGELCGKSEISISLRLIVRESLLKLYVSTILSSYR